MGFDLDNFALNSAMGAPMLGDNDSKEVWKYGSPLDPQAWNRMQYDKDFDEEKLQALKTAKIRLQAQKFLANVARDRRASYLKNYQPVENQLMNQARTGINPDYGTIGTEAMTDVDRAFDIQAGENERNLRRYGIDPSMLNDPEIRRSTDMERTAGKVFAANTATADARDRSEQTNAARGLQALALVPGQAELAAGEYQAGAQALADVNDYKQMQLTRKFNSNVSRDTGLSSIIGGGAGAIAGAFADGGLVDAGGRPGKTIDLRKAYSDYVIDASSGGEEPKRWPEWLETQGYRLEPDNLVNRSGYADGGQVGYGVGRVINGHADRVDLDTNDYIMPADVVDAMGVEYFDRLVAENSDSERWYADGGSVNYGFGVARFASGFSRGLRNAKENEMLDQQIAANKEDREYLRQERGVQSNQRQLAQRKAEMDRDLAGATTAFVSSDGVDIRPILAVKNKYFGTNDNVSITPAEDGSAYVLSPVGPDGKPTGQTRKMTKDELRALGMGTIQAMTDPSALMKAWGEKPTTVTTAEGAVTKAWDPQTRTWKEVTNNPRSDRSGGRGGSEVLGWKDHNQMNDDIQRLAFRRFSVPNPNGIGSILDPTGQQKAKLFKDIVFAQLDSLNKSPRELTSSELNTATSLAETRVENEFRRRGAKGIEGSGKGWLKVFDAGKAAADMANFFPTGGNEPEVRAFMAQHDITDKADQDAVLAKMPEYQSVPSGGYGVGAQRPSAEKPAVPAKGRPEASGKPLTAPPGFTKSMVQAVNALAGRKDQRAVAAKLKELGHSDAEVQQVMDFYQQNIGR